MFPRLAKYYVVEIRTGLIQDIDWMENMKELMERVLQKIETACLKQFNFEEDLKNAAAYLEIATFIESRKFSKITQGNGKNILGRNRCLCTRSPLYYRNPQRELPFTLLPFAKAWQRFTAAAWKLHQSTTKILILKQILIINDILLLWLVSYDVHVSMQ